MVLVKRILFIALAMGLSTCLLGNENQQISPRIKIDIPAADLTFEQMSAAASALGVFFSDGQREVSIDELASAIGINRAESPLALIIRSALETRDEMVQLTCLNRSCQIKSSGNSTRIPLDGIELPGLGSAELSVASNIALEMLIPTDLHKIEVCSISGLTIRSGFIRQNLDGLLIKSTGTELSEAFLDVGFGGDYPKANCQ